MRNVVLGAIFGCVLMVLGATGSVGATPNSFGGNQGTGAQSLPSPFTLLNNAEIFQINLCVGCGAAIQTNIADLVQTNVANPTRIMSSLGNLLQQMPGGHDRDWEGFVTSFQANVGQIRQFNLCMDCLEVDQANFASLTQQNLGSPIQQNLGLIDQANASVFGVATPEPGTLLLLVSGIVPLVLWRGLLARRARILRPL